MYLPYLACLNVRVTSTVMVFEPLVLVTTPCRVRRVLRVSVMSARLLTADLLGAFVHHGLDARDVAAQRADARRIGGSLGRRLEVQAEELLLQVGEIELELRVLLAACFVGLHRGESGSR